MAVFVPARSLIQPDVLFTFDSSRSNGKNVANDGVLNSIELLISTDCGISWINHVNGLYFDGNVTECSNYSVFSNDFNAAIKNINNMSAFSFEIWFTPYQSYSSVFAGIGDWIPNTDFMSVSSTGLPWWAMYMNNLDAVTASDSSIFTFSAYEASLLSTTHPNHVVFTISSADDLYANVYVNGNLHDQFNEEYQGLLPLSLGTQLILASALNSENQSFNGNVYLVAVYSQALTEYEVQQNFNASISIPLPYVNQSEMLLSANCSSSSSCHLPELIVSTTSSVDLIYARLVSLPSFGTLYDEVNTTTAYRILTVPYNVTGRLIFQFSFSFGLALFDWQGCGLAGCNPMNATFKIYASDNLSSFSTGISVSNFATKPVYTNSSSSSIRPHYTNSSNIYTKPAYTNSSSSSIRPHYTNSSNTFNLTASIIEIGGVSNTFNASDSTPYTLNTADGIIIEGYSFKWNKVGINFIERPVSSIFRQSERIISDNLNCTESVTASICVNANAVRLALNPTAMNNFMPPASCLVIQCTMSEIQQRFMPLSFYSELEGRYQIQVLVVRMSDGSGIVESIANIGIRSLPQLNEQIVSWVLIGVAASSLFALVWTLHILKHQNHASKRDMLKLHKIFEDSTCFATDTDEDDALVHLSLENRHLIFDGMCIVSNSLYFEPHGIHAKRNYMTTTSPSTRSK